MRIGQLFFEVIFPHFPERRLPYGRAPGADVVEGLRIPRHVSGTSVTPPLPIFYFRRPDFSIGRHLPRGLLAGRIELTPSS